MALATNAKSESLVAISMLPNSPRGRFAIAVHKHISVWSAKILLFGQNAADVRGVLLVRGRGVLLRRPARASRLACDSPTALIVAEAARITRLAHPQGPTAL